MTIIMHRLLIFFSSIAIICAGGNASAGGNARASSNSDSSAGSANLSAIAIANTGSAGASPKAQSIHKLWDQYRKAESKDLPAEQLSALQRIKEEARKQRSAWDFYEASHQSADIASRSNWKLRDSARRASTREIIEFGEPIAIISEMLYCGEWDWNEAVKELCGQKPAAEAPQAVAEVPLTQSSLCATIAEYIRCNEGQLRNSHNSCFYTKASLLFNFKFHQALTDSLTSDLDFAVWTLLAFDPSSSEAKTLAVNTFRGRYPYSLLLEYYQCASQSELEQFAERHKGSPVALYAQADLLQLRFERLINSESSSQSSSGSSAQALSSDSNSQTPSTSNSRASSQDYLSLKASVQALIRSARSFRGKDRIIAKHFYNSPLLTTLESKQIQLSYHSDTLTATLRNIPSLRIRILKGSKLVYNTTIANSRRSYYAADTIQHQLPSLPDGEYSIECSYSSTHDQLSYKQHSLSLATKDGGSGFPSEFYLADYQSGEPLSSCSLLLFDSDGKLLSELSCETTTKTQSRLNSAALPSPVLQPISEAFTPLPEAIREQLRGKRARYQLQAKTQSPSGQTRLSPKLQLYSSSTPSLPSTERETRNALLLTDKGAYRPEETLQFKVILYNGDFAHSLAPEGSQIQIELLNNQGKLVSSQALTTNEFGSAAGSFSFFPIQAEAKDSDSQTNPKATSPQTKPKTPNKNTPSPQAQSSPETSTTSSPETSIPLGRYSLRVRSGNQILESRSILVDEFTLPSFELQWDPGQSRYFPSDQICFSGIVRSYSGHNLSSATSSYTVQSGSRIIASGQAEFDSEGRFAVEFQASEASYDHYSITLKVSDSTGETLEWSKFASSSAHPGFYPHISKEAKGQASSRGIHLPIVEDTLKLSLGDFYPRASFDFKLKRDGAPAYTDQSTLNPQGSTYQQTTTHEIALQNQPSGQYELEISAHYTSDSGKQYSEKRSLSFYLFHPGDKQLASSLDCFWRDIPSDALAVQAGSTGGPSWIIAELYSSGSKLLESKLFRIPEDEIATIGFERKDGYEGKLSLQLLFFKNSQSFSYIRSFEAARPKSALPLRFTRFLDTTSPSSSYSFQIESTSGVECAASIFDTSSETLWPNRWEAVRAREPYYGSPGYSTASGSKQAGYFSRVIAYGSRGFGRQSKALAVFAEEESVSLNSLAADSISESEEAPAAEPIPIRSNFATTLAWEPFLRSNDNGQISLNFRTSDRLSRFKVQLFAHDKAMRNSCISREMTVSLPVKVAIVQPQYIYASDSYSAMVSVANSHTGAVEGQLYLQQKGHPRQSHSLSVPAGGSAAWSFPVLAGSDEEIELTVGFVPDGSEFGGDAVRVVIPVKKSSQLMIESHSALLRAGQDRSEIEKKLRAEFKNIPGRKAVAREISIRQMLLDALPKELEPRGEDVVSLSDALYCGYLLGREADMEIAGKIAACRGSKGGFAWYAGMSSSESVTAAVLTRLLAMKPALPEALSSLIEDAAGFLDERMLEAKRLPYWCGALSLEQYLRVRSLCPEFGVRAKGADAKRLALLRREARAFLVPDGARGLNAQLYAKMQRACVLENLLRLEGGVEFASFWGVRLFGETRLEESLKADIASLEQYAQAHWSGGMYFPNLVMPLRGLLDSELRSHSQMCGLMERAGRQELADGLRLWIMVQKETQDWGSDPAYLEALGVVGAGSEELLSTAVLELSASEELPFESVRASGNGMRLECEYFRGGKKLKDGDVLRLGDKVIAKYRLWNAENRSFVRLVAPRPACLRPVDQISRQLGWWLRPLSVGLGARLTPQCFRTVREDQTEWAFDCLPEETVELSEELFVSQQGRFRAPAPVLECLYAPHYRANSLPRDFSCAL